MKNIYTYDDRDFNSIKALANYTGINEKTLTARLRRGIPIDIACQNIDYRCSYQLYKNESELKSISQICKENSKDQDLVRNRLHYGYSLHEALNKPKKISKQGRPIVVNGILYNSISEALRKLDLVDKEQTVRRRLAKGISPNNAFNIY